MTDFLNLPEELIPQIVHLGGGLVQLGIVRRAHPKHKECDYTICHKSFLEKRWGLPKLMVRQLGAADAEQLLVWLETQAKSSLYQSVHKTLEAIRAHPVIPSCTEGSEFNEVWMAFRCVP